MKASSHWCGQNSCRIKMSACSDVSAFGTLGSVLRKDCVYSTDIYCTLWYTPGWRGELGSPCLKKNLQSRKENRLGHNGKRKQIKVSEDIRSRRCGLSCTDAKARKNFQSSPRRIIKGREY